MRYIRYAFWAIVGLCLIVLSLANRELVELQALPSALADLAGVSPTVQIPLFVAILLGVALGLVIGLIWEWIREYKHRAAVSRKDREAKALQREVDRLKAEKHEGKDEVLALLE
ncbi:LapA family protein [Pelagovum pacificum]|uniref:LapA family protein n=1 Tax=Pelagovum pacificum TaxID=2588711 RepID=A0A5C5GBR3_9RHOB|nr:LapA family protein [Pelagovum pacificum]QQA42327.1 LapA family protein [Pelagovum pacificum]TNY31412.1 LapA family protein [Pelagovum pacificum]